MAWPFRRPPSWEYADGGMIQGCGMPGCMIWKVNHVRQLKFRRAHVRKAVLYDSRDYIIDLSEDESLDGAFADEGPPEAESPFQAPEPSPAHPQKRSRTESPELSPGADCELEFEGDQTSDEEFIPRNAKLARPALIKDLHGTTAHEEKGPKLQRLPSQLQALLPTLQLSAPRELDAANVLTEQQTKAVQYVASMARPKSQSAEPGLQRRLSKWGYGKDTLAKVLAYIRDEAPIVIHVDLVKYVASFQAAGGSVP
ncbi:unnamed protein product [Symbiodinium natans]|uniref:Uncharacterized protein n=1 Tax=Symbiodinium natans TaxID=878477 RepID=A0A812V5V1_9DINO|nr:unnamed protein product [Symbiodinium natans]